MSVDTSKGWFIIPGIRDKGDRSIKEQMRGLEKALLYAEGKTVLDLGCAEGCISIEFAKAGAKTVLGVEVLEYHLEVANKLREGYPNVRFMQGFIENLAEQETTDAQWDVVLALAVLHKLRDVSAGLNYVARSARELVVFRWPQWFDPKGYLRSKRHAGEVHVPTVMRRHGFEMERTLLGPNAEPVQYWRKKV